MSEKRTASNVAHLRAGDIGSDEVVSPVGESAAYRQMRDLSVLDERLRVEGYGDLLEDLDRAIVEEAVRICGIQYSRVAAAVHRDRSTVWRRIKKLLVKAAGMRRYAEKLLGEASPQQWCVTMEMAKAYAHHSSASTISRRDVLLDIESYSCLARMYRGGYEAQLRLRPSTGPTVEYRGDRMTISGPGPLPPVLRAALQDGRAERIYDGPPRCHGCGRYVRKALTGRPRKFCSEACRSRFRRSSR
jgi:hypothetical protein